MHIISKKKLREFWEQTSKAQSPLEAWYQVARSAEWESFADVRKTFSTADQVGKFTVFNIGGNKYRLIAVIHFNRGKLFVRQVLTHAEYDEDKWKDESLWHVHETQLRAGPCTASVKIAICNWFGNSPCAHFTVTPTLMRRSR